MLGALYDVDIHQYNRHCLCLTAACIVQTVCIDFLPQKQLTDTRCTFDKIMLSSDQVLKYNIIVSAYSSHCSDQSGVSLFSLTDVWNFSFPRPIVTKASLVPADMIFLTDINRGGRAVV